MKKFLITITICLLGIVGIAKAASVFDVYQGGTGASTFGQGWINTSGGGTALTSSTSPTVNYIFATSTTIASNFPFASTTAINIGADFITDINGTGLALSAAGILTATLGTNIVPSELNSAISAGNILIGTNAAGTAFTATGSPQLTAGYYTASSSVASTFPYASTTMITASNGLITSASTTVGAGGQITGLTINGGSTTTLNAYFAGKIGVGTTSPYAPLSIVGTGGAVAESFNATNTSATSTFSGSMHIGTLFGGQFAPTGFFSTSGYHELDIGDTVDEGLSLLTIGNRSTGTFAAGCITLVNSNTPFLGGINAGYNANLCLAGPNFAALQGLPANALALDNTDGDVILGAISANSASSSLRFASGLGYITANYDLNLITPNSTLFPNSGGFANLGLGTTTPWARYAIVSSSTNPIPFFLVASSTNGSNSTVGTVPQQNVFSINSNGRVGIGASTTPGTTFTIGNTGASTILLSETSTSTFGSGLNIKTGCFSINGTCLSTGGGSGSGTVSSGIFGQATFYGANGTTVSGTSTLVFGTTTAATPVGIGSTSPTMGALVISGGGIVTPEYAPATSTSMTIDAASSTPNVSAPQVRVNIGTSNTTLTMANLIAGSAQTVLVCNPGATAGIVTWAAANSVNILWPGLQAQPTSTRTANHCDAWTFRAAVATTSLVYFGTQIPY